jgi:AbrB family looped-hinge helix DNA binding protein
MDRAGRITIPKPVREAARLRPGTEVEITEDNGRIQIEVVSRPVLLTERDGFLAAEVESDDGPPLTVEEVRHLRG